VSVLHDVVHLLFGGAGVAMARTAASATAYLVGGGIVYLLLWVYGLVIERDSAANVVPLNEADQWLHLVLAVALTGAGLLLGRRRGDERACPPARRPLAVAGAVVQDLPSRRGTRRPGRSS
jgi:hypothetical protein